MRWIEAGSNVSVPKETKRVGFGSAGQFCESLGSHYEGYNTCGVEVISCKSQKIFEAVKTGKAKRILSPLCYTFTEG